MATPRALFTPATWSEDDSDEEEHFREMVRLRIRHEERFRDVHDVNVPEHRPPDPIWGEPPRTAGAAPRSPDSDVDENADPWGDFDASPRRVTETRGDGNAPARDPPDDDSTFMPRTAEVRSLAGQLAKLGIEVPYQRSPGHEARGDVAWDAAAHEAMLGRPRPRMKPAVDSTRTTTTTTRPRPTKRKNAMKPAFAVPTSPAKPPLYAPPVVATPGRADAGAGRPGARTAGAATRGRTRPRRPDREPVAVSVESHEIASPGALSESAHFGVYAHLWWSGGRGAGAGTDSDSGCGTDSDCFPYPIGFRVRAALRIQRSPKRSTEPRRNETAKRLGGVVRRRGTDGSSRAADGTLDDGSSSTCVLECSVGMSGVSSRRDVNGCQPRPPHCTAWDGPCFRVEWAGGDAYGAGLSGTRTRRWDGSCSNGHNARGGGRTRTPVVGRGRTPGAALAALLDAMGGGTPRGSGVWGGLSGEEAFGFVARVGAKVGAEVGAKVGAEVGASSPPPNTTTTTKTRSVRDGLDELVARACFVRPVRLRAPHGVGLALVRGSAYAGLGLDAGLGNSKRPKGGVSGVDGVDCSNPSRGVSIDTHSSIDRGLVAAAVASPDVFVSADGEREYPLLPGYQVSFELSPGVHVACRLALEAVAREPKGRGFESRVRPVFDPRVAFRVERRDGPRVVESCCAQAGDPERCWRKVPSLMRRCAVDAVPSRTLGVCEKLNREARSGVDRFEGLGAHLFGLESREVLELLRGHRRAMASAGGEEWCPRLPPAEKGEEEGADAGT